MSQHGEFAGMSQQTFDENEPAILAALRALMSNPKSRNRYRLGAIYAKPTGELLMEVFRTNHGPVVVYRSALGWTTHPDDGRDIYNAFRQGHGSNLTVAPLTGKEGQVFVLISRKSLGQERVDAEIITKWLLVKADKGQRDRFRFHYKTTFGLVFQ